MRSRIPCRTKSADNFIPAGDASFPSLFCYAQACFVMLIFGLVNLVGTFLFLLLTFVCRTPNLKYDDFPAFEHLNGFV